MEATHQVKKLQPADTTAGDSRDHWPWVRRAPCKRKAKQKNQRKGSLHSVPPRREQPTFTSIITTPL